MKQQYQWIEFCIEQNDAPYYNLGYLFNGLLFCSECKTLPLIKSIEPTFKTAFVSCKCNKEKKEMMLKEISGKYLINFSGVKELYVYFQCENHKEVFESYCENCERNLCKECPFNHECDIKYIRDFRNMYYNIENMIFFLNDFINKILIIDESIKEFKYLIIYIIETLFPLFKIFPNYNIIENITNLFNICSKIISLKDFSLLNLIKRLDLEGKLLNNLFFLKNKDLSKLKELNLENNKLENNQIDIFNNLNCYDLERLNLGLNHFTNYKLLLIIAQRFLQLKELNLHSNRLYEDIEILKNNNISYNSLEYLNLSNGVFSNDTIEFISSLIFKNLVFLDLSSNNLNSLSFVKKVNFGKEKNTIKKLMLQNNEISLENLSTENIQMLFSEYLNLETLILEMDYPIEYKGDKNLGFKIFWFDRNKISEYLLDQYENDTNKNKLKTLVDYQQFYENKSGL